MIDELWNDFKFRTLLTDLLKAKKSEDEQKMRAEALINYLRAEGKSEAATEPAQAVAQIAEPIDPNKRPGPGPALRAWEVDRVRRTAEQSGQTFQMEFGLDYDVQWLHDDLTMAGINNIEVTNKGMGALPLSSLGTYTPDSMPSGGRLDQKWVVTFSKL